MGCRGFTKLLTAIGVYDALTYANKALRDIMLKGWGLTEIWPNIAILLGFTVLFTIIGVLMTRREVA